MLSPEASNWSFGLFSGYFHDCCNCCYGTCCPLCAVASAKSLYDDSQWYYNCCCFSNVVLVRNYIRLGYGIRGNVGTADVCVSYCCLPCAVTQLLNEVQLRGIVEHPYVDYKNGHVATKLPMEMRNFDRMGAGEDHESVSSFNSSVTSFRPTSSNSPPPGSVGILSREVDIIERADKIDEQYQYEMNQTYHWESDPLSCCCTVAGGSCEVARIYANVQKMPMWFPFYSGLSLCQLQHMVRKSNIRGIEKIYGIINDKFEADEQGCCTCGSGTSGNEEQMCGGYGCDTRTDCWRDCVVPYSNGCIPGWNCIWYYRSLHQIQHAIDRHRYHRRNIESSQRMNSSNNSSSNAT